MAEPGDRKRGMDSTRVTAFTDGLFVVAATLLVVSIDIPNIPDAQVSTVLPHALDDIVPQLLSYFISFAVIVLFWFRHHALFGRVHTHDARFVALNMLFLAFIAVLPFPTELVGKYGQEPISAVIYSINVLVLSGLLTILYVYSERHGLLRPDSEYTRHRLRALSVFIVFGAAIPIALIFGARAAQYTWLTMLVVPRIVVRLSGGRAE
jgi:TMEM175 potassium channel family protein